MTSPTDSTTGERDRIIAALMAVDGLRGPFTPNDRHPRYDLYADAILSRPSRMAASSDHSSDAPQMVAASSEGWVLVPVEPTQAMLDADFGVVKEGSPVAGEIGKRIYESRRDLRPMIYRAMLAARPEAGREVEPVAWTFEYLCDNGADEPSWEPGASALNPSKWTAFQHRNIQPAYAHPASTPSVAVPVSEERVEAAARAHDAEEAAQKGEPSPWTHYNCDDGDLSEADCPDCKAFREERLSTMRCALTAALAVPDQGVQEDQGAARAREFIDNWFSPWGSWKTAWWEMAVSDGVEMSDANAMRAVQKILSPTSTDRRA